MTLPDTNTFGTIDHDINQCLKPSTTPDEYEKLLSNVVKQLIKLSLCNDQRKINISQLQSLR